MQDQQETGTATPSDQPSAATAATNEPPKLKRNPNRRERRSSMAIQAKYKRLFQIASNSRLAEFRKLTFWKDREVSRTNRMTDEQIASVFRVALARLFKGKEVVRKREKISFDDQLKAIVRNVKNGFTYKSDVAPTGSEVSTPAE